MISCVVFKLISLALILLFLCVCCVCFCFSVPFRVEREWSVYSVAVYGCVCVWWVMTRSLISVPYMSLESHSAHTAHSSHTTHTAHTTSAASRFLLWNISHNAFGRCQQRCNACSISQSSTHNLANKKEQSMLCWFHIRVLVSSATKVIIGIPWLDRWCLVRPCWRIRRSMHRSQFLGQPVQF